MKPLISTLAILSLPLFALANGDDTANAGGDKVDNAYAGVMQDRSADSEEEALYVEKCSMCHRQMGMGTVLLSRRLGRDQAILEQRDDLNRELIEFSVRKGIGNMPRISNAEVSDAQLDTIVTWLTQQNEETE